MNHPSAPEFCEVCQEALVLALYGKVRPLDSWVPAADSLACTTDTLLSFRVSLLRSPTYPIFVQWFTNGVPVPNATGLTFEVSANAFGIGTHRVSVGVTDSTSSVRNDPTGLLAQTKTWTVDVNVPVLRFANSLGLSATQITFGVTGDAPRGFVLETSTDFIEWSSLSTNALSSGECWFTNAIQTNVTARFFRAKSL